MIFLNFQILPLVFTVLSHFYFSWGYRYSLPVPVFPHKAFPLPLLLDAVLSTVRVLPRVLYACPLAIAAWVTFAKGCPGRAHFPWTLHLLLPVPRLPWCHGKCHLWNSSGTHTCASWHFRKAAPQGGILGDLQCGVGGGYFPHPSLCKQF